jgi:hypothetical protein
MWGRRGVAQRTYNHDTRRRWVVSLTPRPLYILGRSSGTHWMGDSVNARAVLDALGREIALPLPGVEPRILAIQSVTKSLCRRNCLGSSQYLFHVLSAPVTFSYDCWYLTGSLLWGSVNTCNDKKRAPRPETFWKHRRGTEWSKKSRSENTALRTEWKTRRIQAPH